jgi:hypothetical protein
LVVGSRFLFPVTVAGGSSVGCLKKSSTSIFYFYLILKTKTTESKMSDVVTPDVREEVAPEPEVDTTKTKKLAQLAAARESAKMKKRKREEDLDSMSERLDRLTSLLTTKQEEKQEHRDADEEEETPATKKPRRVTKEADTPAREIATQEDSWTTSLIRTGSLISLAGLSYYFQNMYGKERKQQKKKIDKKPSFVKPVQPSHNSNTAVGMSGFTL